MHYLSQWGAVSSEETRYRQSCLPEDIKQAKLGISLLTIPLQLYLFNDFQFFGFSTEFYVLAVLRFAFLAITVFMLSYLPRLKNYRSYDKAVFTWCFVGVVVALIINALRPQNFVLHIIIVIAIIAITYLVIPQKTVGKIIIASSVSIGELLIIVLLAQTIEIAALFSITVTLAWANIIGLLSYRSLNSYRFKEFQAREKIEYLASFPVLNPNPVIEIDLAGVVQYTNSAADKMFPDLKSANRSHPLFSNLDEITKATQANPKDSFSREIRIGDHWFIEHCYLAPNNNNIRFYIVQIDERKKAEEKLKETAQKLAIANEKLRVSVNLSKHDVRNKLSVVTTYAFLLKKKYSTHTDIVEALSKMEQAVKNSVDILEFAQIYAQLGGEELTYVDAGKAIDEAVALFEKLSFKVVNECHGLSLFADSFLRQLFYNFIDNTRKYGKKTTIVRISYEVTMQDTLLLIYEDDGIGIPEKDKHKLFAEGFSTSFSTGLGLFLIKKMIEIYGWKIHETGEAGKGAKFVITIPKINAVGKENYKIGSTEEGNNQ
ncbi:MAG: HAMP domain-containing sensor histidine kinase [Candidatus Bathyarchaeia archaeon]